MLLLIPYINASERRGAALKEQEQVKPEANLAEWLVVATSKCGTYSETLRCLTATEAADYAQALRETDEWNVRVVPPVKA